MIEWLPLNDGERRTGSELAEVIEQWQRVELRVCWTRDDIIAALTEAHAHLKATGEIPIVHFEAHGFTDREDGADRAGICFSQRGGIEQELTWSEIAPYLRALNHDSQCRLLVVGASCFGLAGLDMWSIDSFAPFSSIIGFNAKVSTTTLASSMRELYHQLFVGGHKNIPLAVEAANRELRDGEHLVTTSMHKHVGDTLRGFINRELDPRTRTVDFERLKILHNANHPDDPWGDETLNYHWRVIAERHCNRLLEVCFDYATFPENRRRFPVSVRALLNAATRRIEKRSPLPPSQARDKWPPVSAPVINA
ncbi:hypothetical protein [Dyella sp. 333MFSha]|uniref:hypothetical protein n=1 Tax=Dyella sp. 333MFSha TaxID=1798240 RepID=UPI000B86331A|nr:hypothetical protein [Dyella sp. 333MFSha]